MRIDCPDNGTAGARLVMAGILVALVGCHGSAGPPPGVVPPTAPDGVRVIAWESFYDISGRTAEDLAIAMQEHGPGDAEVGLVGSHAWAIRGEFGPNSRGWGCTFGDGRLNVWSTITMPRWVDRDDADPALVAEWDRFVVGLWNHQYAHREIAYRAAREALGRLKAFEGRSCRARATADFEVRQVIAEYRELTRLFDAATGATVSGAAGAYWPPTEVPAEAGSPVP